MSLDGFIAGPNEGPGNGLGDGGHRLHEWALRGADADDAEVGRPAGVNGEVFDEMMSTGAIVAGRGTFELAGGWGGDHHDGMPIFIVARHEAGIDISQWPLVTYVNDVATAMTQAKEAAGGKNVLVHGAGTTQLALAVGVLDEMELHVVPVLFGQGRRLFEGLELGQTELERTRILEGEGGVTHMHYRVQTSSTAARTRDA
jgi:dihydrofolate reductase